jgi:ketol-acid reductoisomerase
MNHMNSAGPRQTPLSLKGARVAVLGYGLAAREHALGLRRAGSTVCIGLRLGGMSWVRAREDGFVAEGASVAASGADVVVVLVPDDEQTGVYFHAIESAVARGALLVFGRGVALATGTFEPQGVDVVFVAGGDGHCRVAVHHDATGTALERAVAYARAVFGASAAITTTTVESEAASEVASMAERAGSYAALAAEVDRALSRACESHAPDEAKVRFYERLRELVERHSLPPSTTLERRSGASLVAGQGPRRGLS